MWESVLLAASWQSFEIHRRIWTHAREINQGEPFSKKHVRMCLECARITLSGHVVLAGCGEASAAMAVDGRYPELVPALRSQVWQNHILWKGLKTHNWQLPTGKKKTKQHLQFKLYIRSQRESVDIPQLPGLLKGCRAIQLVTGKENLKASELDKWVGMPIQQEQSSRKAGKTDQPSGTDPPSYLQTGEVSVEEIEKPLENKSQTGFSEEPLSLSWLAGVTFIKIWRPADLSDEMKCFCY